MAARQAVFVIAAISLTLLTLTPLIAQSPALLTLSSPEVVVGEVSTVDATIDCGGVRCTTFEVIVTYDPELIRVEGVTLGGYLGDNTTVLQQRIDNDSGELRFAAVALGAPPPPTDDLLFTIDLIALAVGATEIKLAEAVVGDLEPLPVILRDGFIEIHLPKTPTPSPSPPPTDSPTPSSSVVFTREIDLYYRDNSGNERMIVSTGDSYEPDLFADQVVFASAREGRRLDIYVYDLTAGVERRLTTDAAQDRHPVFSPDGRQIAFTSDRSGNWEIYIMDADGSNMRNATNSEAQEYAPAWASGGTQLVFQSDRSGKYEYETIELISGERRQITQYNVPLVGAVVSPDSEWIVGYANVEPPYWVLVRTLDGSVTAGQRGVPTDWIDGETFVYHRAADASETIRSVYTHNIYTDSEQVLIVDGIWGAVFP